MTNYDSWLESLIPEEAIEPEVVEIAVPCEFGAFNWQVFTKRYNQNNVPDWAWQVCENGPFITPYAKLRFAIHLVCAKIRLAFVKRSRVWNPITLATHSSRYFIDQRYLDGAAEVERTWSDDFAPWIVKAREEESKKIVIYGEEADQDFFDL